MMEVHELVCDWAYRHCPALLDDEELLNGLCCFILQIIDFSLLSARRQVYVEIRREKSN